MPLISITLVKGRSQERIRTLTADVTEAVARALEVPPEVVSVHIHELEPDRVARGGILRSDA
jgi:4-oxalocrotonate tautomerase